MTLVEDLLATAVETSEMSESDLLFVVAKGERKTYAPGEYLFHEGAPCLWSGIIEDGLVELERDLHGSRTFVSVLSRGATIAEAAIMADTSHYASAFTRKGVTVWQIPREIWEAARQSHPDIYYRIVGRVAMRLSYAAGQLALARAALLKNCDQVLREGWMSRAVLEYIMKPEK